MKKELFRAVKITYSDGSEGYRVESKTLLRENHWWYGDKWSAWQIRCWRDTEKEILGEVNKLRAQADIFIVKQTVINGEVDIAF